MKKIFKTIIGLTLGFAMAIGVGAGIGVLNSKDAKPVYAADQSAGWTATSGALGSGIGSGTISTGAYEWGYTRTLISGVSYTGWSSSCIQLGKNGGVENLELTTNEIPGIIKSVSVECASYGGAHKVSITVGSSTYLASTATSSWMTVSTKSGTGTASGTITVSFTDGSRALYIKSLNVSYEQAGTTHTVTFNPLNGEESTEQEVAEGSSIYSLPTPTKAKDSANHIRYAFEGWYTVDDPSNPVFENGNKFIAGTTTVDDDMDLYANYNEYHYNIVSFNSNGGSEVSEQEIDDGENASLPQPNPTKSGYSFVGWYTENGTAFNFQTTGINEDITLYAHWESIIIEENGVFVKVTNTEQLVDGGKYLIVYNNQKAFDGSLDTLDAASNTVDVEFEGAYIKKDNNTKTAYFTITTSNNKKYIKSASGHYIGRSASTNGLNTYSVENNDSANTIAFDSSEDKNAIITSSSGLTLRYNSTSGQERFRYFTNSSQQPVQLYKFVRTYTVSFETNGGTEIDNMTVLSGDTIVLPNNPTKAADANYSYTFEGWYTNVGLTEPFVASTPITSNLTLYAKYTSEEIDSPSAYLDFASSLATIHARQSVSMQNRTHDIDFASLNLEDAHQYLEPFEDADHKFTVTFAGGGNDGKYYNTGTAIRTYGGGTITIESESTIKAISFTWFDNQDNKPSSSDMVNTGTYDVATAAWTGSATSVVLTRPSGSGHWRLQAVEVTLYESVTSVSDVCMRFGISISKDSWDSINTKFGISDYGVMLLKKTTLESQAYNGYDTVEAAFRGGKAVTDKNKGSGEAPYLYTSTNTYAFTLKLNVGEDYNTIVRAAPYIIAGGEYYFLEEKEYSAKTLAQHFLDNPLEECAVCNAGLRAIIGTN